MMQKSSRMRQAGVVRKPIRAVRTDDTPRTHIKLPREQRRQVVLTAILQVAMRDGLAALTYEAVADQCEIETSPATVRRYGGRLDEMQTKAVNRASGAQREWLKAELARLNASA